MIYLKDFIKILERHKKYLYFFNTDPDFLTIFTMNQFQGCLLTLFHKHLIFSYIPDTWLMFP